MAHDELFDLIFTPSTLIKSSVLAALLIELRVILNQRDKIDSLGELISSIETSYRSLLERDDVPDDIRQNIKDKLDEIDRIRRSS